MVCIYANDDSFKVNALEERVSLASSLLCEDEKIREKEQKESFHRNNNLHLETVEIETFSLRGVSSVNSSTCIIINNMRIWN